MLASMNRPLNGAQTKVDRCAFCCDRFVVVVPPGEAGERFLDLVWRFTMVYAFMPSWLIRRAKVAKMVGAVMGKESRERKG